MQDGTNVKKGDRGLMIEFSTCFSEGEKCPTLTRYPPVGTNSYMPFQPALLSRWLSFSKGGIWRRFFVGYFGISSKDISHTQYPSPDSMLLYPRAYHLSLAAKLWWKLTGLSYKFWKKKQRVASCTCLRRSHFEHFFTYLYVYIYIVSIYYHLVCSISLCTILVRVKYPVNT